MPDNELCQKHTEEIAAVKEDTRSMRFNLEEVRKGTGEIRDALLGTMKAEGYISKSTRIQAEHWLWIRGLSWITGMIVAAIVAVWIKAL